MIKHFHIKTSNLPSRLPIVTTVVLFIALDHWNASDLVRGIFYTLFAVVWILSIIGIYVGEEVDLFEFEKDEPRTEAKAKSKFQERLEKLAKERGITL